MEAYVNNHKDVTFLTHCFTKDGTTLLMVIDLDAIEEKIYQVIEIVEKGVTFQHMFEKSREMVDCYFDLRLVHNK